MLRSEYAANQALQQPAQRMSWAQPSTARWNRTHTRSSFLYVAVLSMVAFVLSVAFSSAHACVTGPWHSTHKDLHAIGNAGIVFGVDMALKAEAPETFERYPYLGLVPAVLTSAGRELWKEKHGGSCEWSSITYDAAGMAVGAAGTHWLLVPQDKGILVAYYKAF